MDWEWVEISKINLSKEVMIRLDDVGVFDVDTPLIIDNDFNLINGYEIYFNYLLNKRLLVPVLRYNPNENFYFDEINLAA
jgi:hypothetical protein